MTKKRNHYIPRLLLRRFAFRETNKGAYLWRFSNGGSPIQLETGNACVESFFYGEPATGVEDDLGAAETGWKQLLDWIDGGGDLMSRHRELWRFAWILGMRTRSMRDSWTKTCLSLLEGMARVSPDAIGAGARKHFEMLRETAWNEALAALPKETAEAARAAVSADPAMKEMIFTRVQSALPSATRQAMEQLLGGAAATAVPGGSARGQIEGLSRILAAEVPQIDAAAPAFWFLLRFPPEAVVLGDRVTFTVGPRREIGAVGRFRGDMEEVYVPVGHDRVLVGQKQPGPTLDLEAINDASVSLSNDWFFASQNSDKERARSSRIAAIEPLIAEGEMGAIVDDVWRRLGQ